MHNITAFKVTERPGTESYDPVLLGGKSVRAAHARAACGAWRHPPPTSAPFRLLTLACRLCVYVQLVDHYPYSTVSSKEVLVNPLTMNK